MGPHESLSEDLSNNYQCYRVSIASNFHFFLNFLILVTTGHWPISSIVFSPKLWAKLHNSHDVAFTAVTLQLMHLYVVED
jgi:hypothetical protein